MILDTENIELENSYNSENVENAEFLEIQKIAKNSKNSIFCWRMIKFILYILCI